MVEHDEILGNPERQEPLELRVAIEAVQRLREVLQGGRCIVCMSELGADNPEKLRIYDLVVCSRAECAAVVNVPIEELLDDSNTDDDGDDAEERTL